MQVTTYSDAAVCWDNSPLGLYSSIAFNLQLASAVSFSWDAAESGPGTISANSVTTSVARRIAVPPKTPSGHPYGLRIKLHLPIDTDTESLSPVSLLS